MTATLTYFVTQVNPSSPSILEESGTIDGRRYA